MKGKNKGFFSDKRVVLVAALLLSFLTWIIIAGFVDPDRESTIRDVVIDYEEGAKDYLDQNLQIVSTEQERYADVVVTGDGAVTGPLDSTSVTVYVDYSTVEGAGVYDLPLRTRKVTEGSYNITDWSLNSGDYSIANNPQRRVKLAFEEVETKQFNVQLKADGIKAAEGYFRDEASIVPATVSVGGPKPEVERIAQVVAEVLDEEERVDRKKITAVPLKFLDSAGEALNVEEMGLTLSTETVDVDIPIMEIHSVGLKVAFTGMPQGFDSEWFENRVRLSTTSLNVVGATAALEQLGNPYVVATYDLNQMELNWESDPINITLPEGVRNYDQLRQITVSLDTTGMAEKTFEVDAESFTVLNGPQGAKITPVADQLSVKLIGDAGQISALLPENITVQIDAFSITGRGQQTIPVRILVPGADRVFAVDSYSLTCNVVDEE